MNRESPPSLITLTASLQPLQARFNAQQTGWQFIAVLSPT